MKTQPNIFLGNEYTDTLLYKPSSMGGQSPKYPERINPYEHGSRLREEFESGLKEAKNESGESRLGFYLSVNGQKNYDLAVNSLDNQRNGSSILLNVRNKDNETSATIYVPFDKSGVFLKKVEAYIESSNENAKPKNNNLIRSIETIKRASLASFWTGTLDDIPHEEKADCEIWLWTKKLKHSEDVLSNDVNSEEEKVFFRCCNQLYIKVADTRICLPERIVRLVNADGKQLENLICLCDYIAEIRKASFPNSFITNEDLSRQKAHKKGLLDRIRFEDNRVSVCILDAGVNKNHPLLCYAIGDEETHTVRPEWGKDEIGFGHGTEMAGIALYGNLHAAIENRGNVVVNHFLESVKIISKRSANPPELYGDVTKRAIALAEIARPERKRVFCMAITCPGSDFNNGVPSSWSSAIDSIVSGAEDDEKRLFLISAGDVETTELRLQAYPDSSVNHATEDPAQAWNAVAVGAVTEEVSIFEDELKDYRPIAQKGGLSPVSVTSMSWDNRWPIKPEVLFEGGNYITDGFNVDVCDDTSVLTTNHDIRNRLFTTMAGTSPATAKASWFCAQLMSRYPKLWPESVRALMIHSAEWTDAMRTQFLGQGNRRKGDFNEILRSCGYGVPNLGRAYECMNNFVNLVIQAEMKPYRKKDSAICMNEMNIHNLPWPKEELKRLFSSEAKLKVTLSYFIEPFPSERGWKDRYCYQSCGLRFEVNKPQETLVEFKKRVNKMIENDGSNQNTSNGGIRWTLGARNRNKGSVHSDYTQDYTAAELADCSFVAVYPVGGWWKTRKSLNMYNKSVRYSLIVTLSTTETECDLYTPIENQIKNRVAVETTT